MQDSESSPREAYQFGDTAMAAERLRLLAEVFEPSTREFLASLPAPAVRDAADLGCGPGYTTRLLAEMFPAARVLGIDSSAPFVKLARRRPHQRVAYQVADVATTLPGGPYDLLYCRYLLTHLAEPEAAIAAWSERLWPGGLLAIEENDWIRTEEPAFARYLEIVEAMLADARQRLYIGAELDAVADWPTLSKRASELVPVVVSDRSAARMFLPNLATWRERPFVERNYSGGELDRLREELEFLAGGEASGGSITFGRRRLVFERREA